MRKLKSRKKGIFLYSGILIVVLLGNMVYRYWTAPLVKETEHYMIVSSATPEQTEEIAAVAEIVYEGYHEFLGQLGKAVEPHSKLQLKLFKDREEFRRCNNITNWYEAFYRYPYCYQYYASNEKNPYHWAMHEATHQLNNEAGHLILTQWVDEGIACYIGTSKIADKSLHLGQIDMNTYPAWWLPIIATTGDLQADQENISIIPLRAIVSGQGGPDLNKYFNLYYLHWWSLIHFLMNYEDGNYRDGFNRVVSERGTLLSFERNIGKIEDIEPQWYQYVKELKNKMIRI
jgi:hypothetical protein